MAKKIDRFGFVIDPIEGFDPQAETTLFFMQEAGRRGHEIWIFTIPDLAWTGKTLWGSGSRVKILGIGRRPFFRLQERRRIDLATLSVLFLRKDPPFDLSYLHHLYLLERIRGKVFMVNDPDGVMMHSEKFIPLLFPQYCPEVLISRSFAEVERFARTQRRGVVLKPLDGAGGRGVFYLRPGDSNFKVAFETLSDEGKIFLMAQEYLPEVRKGDKRVLLLDGQVLGYFTRIPRSGEHRANLHRGGLLKPCALSSKERKISQEVGAVLKSQGLYFAGLDLIGEKLTEVNVTSPMGINEVNRTMRVRSEKKVIDFVEQKIK